MQKTFTVGMLQDDGAEWKLLEEQLSTGIVILGVPGAGKSRWAWNFLREHVHNRRPYVVVGSGDLEGDLLADHAKEFIRTGDKRLLEKTHLLELSPFRLPRIAAFDPPDWSTKHRDFLHVLRRAWQETAVQARAQALLRSKGEVDFGVQVRLSRVLTNVLMAASTMVEGRRLPFGKVKALVDVWHPEHFEVYNRASRGLPRETLGDFEFLHALRRPQDVRLETESCLNLLRRSLGFLLTQALSGTGEEPSFSMQRAVEQGDNVIVSVKRSSYCSHDQNILFASMLIQDWFEAKLNCPRDKRRGSTLFIDEAHEYLRMLPDLPYYQRICRKYEGAIVLATQDISSMRS